MKFNKKLLCASTVAGLLATMSISTALANQYIKIPEVEQLNQIIANYTDNGRSMNGRAALVNSPNINVLCTGDGASGNLNIGVNPNTYQISVTGSFTPAEGYTHKQAFSKLLQANCVIKQRFVYTINLANNREALGVNGKQYSLTIPGGTGFTFEKAANSDKWILLDGYTADLTFKNN